MTVRADMTIRDQIAGASKEIADDPPPSRMRQLAVTLSSLLSNVTREVAQAEIAYKKELMKQRQTHEAANRAKIEAECSPEYARYLEAKAVRDSLLELVRTCRQVMRSQDEESRLAQ